MEEAIQQPVHEELVITPAIRLSLTESAKWARFLAIVGFVMVGLLVLLALGVGAFMGTLGAMMDFPFPGVFISVLYLIIAALYFFPVLYLYNFASLTLKSLQVNNQEVLAKAFHNLRANLRFMGILTIVVLGLYVLLILIAIAGGIAAVGFLGR